MAANHPFVGELRIGTVAVEMDIPELKDFAIEIGEITVSECECVNQFTGSKTQPAQFTRGYGLVFGRGERKAISMALVDRALRWRELGEENERRAGAGRGIRARPCRQHPGGRLSRTYQAAALRGFSRPSSN